jgi:membrane protein YqaA with SNARE-associated domain
VIRNAGDWIARLNRSKRALWLISIMSFLETIIVPIPIEVVLIPFMATNRHRIWRVATVVTGACLLASLLGYGIGQILYQSAGTWLIETLGYESAYEQFSEVFDRHGFLAILLVGVLPIPFQVAMILAGVSGYPVHLFLLAALIARGVRYYGLAWLVWRFGDGAGRLWRRHALLASVGGALLLATLAVAGNYLAGVVM